MLSIEKPRRGRSRAAVADCSGPYIAPPGVLDDLLPNHPRDDFKRDGDPLFQATEGWPHVLLRPNSRLTALGARPHTLAIIRNDRLWVRPRLKVSRSVSRKCLSHGSDIPAPEPLRACHVALEVRNQAVMARRDNRPKQFKPISTNRIPSCHADKRKPSSFSL